MFAVLAAHSKFGVDNVPIWVEIALTVFGERDMASSGVDTSIPKRLPSSSLDDDEPNSMSYFLVWYLCVSELCVFVL